MKTFFHALGPALLLPLVLFAMLAYPRLEQDIEARRPLAAACYVSEQLRRQIITAETRNDGLPPRYIPILTQYRRLKTSPALMDLSDLSTSLHYYPTSLRKLSEFMLWRRNLPQDLLWRDPVNEILEQLHSLREKDAQASVHRGEMIRKATLGYLRYGLPEVGPTVPAQHGLPPHIAEKGLIFCGERIPLERTDVRKRIEYQIEFLLTDLRDSLGIWLKRKDRFGKVVEQVLAEEALPVEFRLLPALESGYHGTITSPAQARGWWQFAKATATQSLSKDPKLDWTLRVTEAKDERCDLVLASRAAARYLKFMYDRIEDSSGKRSWLTTAAAFNAGLSKIERRTETYGTVNYWDLKLPVETEDYAPRWIALVVIDANRRYYDLVLPSIPPIDFDSLHDVQLAKDLSVSLLAALTHSSVKFIRCINGSLPLRKDAFSASRPSSVVTHTIHIPSGCASSLIRELKSRAYISEEEAKRLNGARVSG